MEAWLEQLHDQQNSLAQSRYLRLQDVCRFRGRNHKRSIIQQGRLLALQSKVNLTDLDPEAMLRLYSGTILAAQGHPIANTAWPLVYMHSDMHRRRRMQRTIRPESSLPLNETLRSVGVEHDERTSVRNYHNGSGLNASSGNAGGGMVGGS